MYSNKDAVAEYQDAVQVAIEHDDYEVLRNLARTQMAQGEEEEAMRLLELGSQAYRNAWGYDEARDNSL